MTLPEIPDEANEWPETVEHLWPVDPPLRLDPGWHHVAWTFDPDGLRLYVDGEAVTE